MATDTLEKFSTQIIINLFRTLTVEEAKAKLKLIEVQVNQDEEKEPLYVPVNTRYITSSRYYSNELDISFTAFILRLCGFRNLPSGVISAILDDLDTISKINQLAKDVYVRFEDAVNGDIQQEMQFFTIQELVAVEG